MIEGVEVLQDEYACKCPAGWHSVGTVCPDKADPITTSAEIGNDGVIE